MNNDKLSKLINKFYNINDLYKDDILSKIEKINLMSEIFNDMKQIGINNSYDPCVLVNDFILSVSPIILR